jgi:D-proline reductase (dithiol) PrdB
MQTGTFAQPEPRDYSTCMTNAVPDPAFNLPTKPLSQSRVAIVTTAALRLRDQDKFLGGDQSFRILPATTEGLILGQISPNFDRSGFIIDPNVVFPVDRLHEMAAEGHIGSVAPQHIAFLGAQGESLATMIMDSGPAAAKVLKDEGVDVVLLTPV